MVCYLAKRTQTIQTKNLLFSSHARHNGGFSLIELIIALGIASIIALLAIPNLINYVQRSRLTEATTVLSELTLRLEKSYLDHRVYSTTANSTACNIRTPSNPQVKYFSYTCEIKDNDGQSYIITAKNNSDVGLGDSERFIYTIDQDGVKTTKAPFDGASFDCWVIKNGNNC